MRPDTLLRRFLGMHHSTVSSKTRLVSIFSRMVCLWIACQAAPSPALGQSKAAVNQDVLNAVNMVVLNAVFPSDVEIALALSAAPEHLRAAATVYVYGKHGYELVKRGTNGFTCLVNRDAFLYGSSDFKPTCWDSGGATTYVPVMLKTGELLAGGASFEEVKAAVDRGFATEVFHAPVSGGIAYMLAGDVDLDPLTGKITHKASAGHYMFYANGATDLQLGVTRDVRAKDPTLPFVTGGGAGAEHGLTYMIAVPSEGEPHAHPAIE